MKISIKVKIFLAVIIVILLITLGYLLLGSAPKQDDIIWGVNFSQMGAESLKLDWKKTYLALMDDLGVKNIKLITNWNFVEGDKKGDDFFDDIDWQIRQAEIRNVKLIYVLGIKTGRWPECHDPKWARQLSVKDEQAELLKYLEKVVLRYKGSKAITAWQVENEPLFNFGECPWYDKKFLKQEIALVKSLDDSRQIISSDSGEQSSWFNIASVADKVGATMYRKVWFHINDTVGFYVDSPFPPVYYYHKAQIIKSVFGKEVICVELQAEPWASKLFYDIPLAEQEKTMNLKQFNSNIEFAKKTGLKEFYLWGAEWWYWLKQDQNRPEIWNQAKLLFRK